MGTEVELAMPTTQPSTVSSPGGVISSVTMNRGSVQGEGVNNDQFPAGLRVLVVDDDPICLLILDRMLRQCLYKVRTCGRATDALAILRENREMFDLVISDVYMPDMDGFKLLELVGLEMDLPVIMMSANGETSAVMKGIRHGACDYLLKPVRIEELKNIWQHVVRKKRREPELVGSLDDKRRHDDGGDGGELYSSANDAADGTLKHPKKRKDVKEEEEDAELDSEDPSTSKKPRVVWSVDLHQQFVSAVNQLGIDKAVPKRILELMNVQGLTRENVASHLQKYRLYLKRISGVAHQPGGLNSAFVGAPDSTFGSAGGGGLGGFGDLRALAATGQLSPQALISTLQAGLLGRLGPPNNSGMAGVDPSLLLQIAALHGVNSTAMVRPSYGQPLLNSPGSLHPSIASGLDLKQHAQGPQQISSFGQTGAAIDKGPAGLATLQQQLSGPASLGGVGQLIGMDNNLPASPNNNSLMMQILQQQAGSQMANGSVLNSSTGGQHLLSSDIGARLPNVSNLATGIGSAVGAPVRPAQDSSLGVTSFASSNGLGSLRRTMGVDNKNLHLANAGNGNISLPPNVSSPSASNGIDGGLIATGRKGLVSNVGEGLPQTGRGLAPNSLPLTGANPGSRPNMGLNNWQGWQSLGPSQEPPTTASHVLSPRYSQGSSGGQALKMGCAQEQGQGRVSGPAAGSMGFQDRFIVDIGRFKPLISNAPSHNEQSTADGELKLKESTFELFLGSKAENGLLPEPFLSDDLLNSYFKQQQQEVMGFTEGDLAADGYTLGNMYVK